ncbi:MAG: exodeoxyribonuclease VII large subunit [Lachnospiraceae bacterium]|nr:exodeoxyribonuclease VII large subunit [Lachnospiraceae bacterium]
MAAERKVWTVGEVNKYIRGVMEDDFLLSDISVQGELSNVKYHSSGHIYFTLKDGDSCISAVMFSSDAINLDFKLGAGDKVVLKGRISVYEKAGTYQIYVNSVKAAGMGELYRKFEELKAELLEMGMFDSMYKKPIPLYTQKLGVVTSPTGAAVRDIINVAKRRNPFIEIILYPAKVQGEGASDSIVRGIQTLEKEKPDVMIIGRGGGSIEDLWAFNEEKVARAVFDCSVPVISGTGHETDVTIADLVADLRAPTPSAAAELAVFDLNSFDDQIANYGDKLKSLMNNRIFRYREGAAEIKVRLEALSPSARLKLQREKLARYRERLTASIMRSLREKTALRALYAEKLSALSPLNTLSRGYTFTEKPDGKPLKSVDDVETGDKISIYLRDGKVLADVNGKEKISYS